MGILLPFPLHPHMASLGPVDTGKQLCGPGPLPWASNQAHSGGDASDQSEGKLPEAGGSPWEGGVVLRLGHPPVPK